MKPSAVIEQNKDAYDIIKRTVESHGFTAPKIFGSVAKGKDTEKSDLDIFVSKGNRKISVLQIIRLENEISSKLGIPVQIVTIESTRGEKWKNTYDEAISL